MTTPTPPNGNGNGNGSYTQKEMLARIEGKLDLLAQKLEAVTLDMAVHEARPFHESARHEVDEMREAAQASKQRLAYYAGGIAVAVFVVEIAARLLG